VAPDLAPPDQGCRSQPPHHLDPPRRHRRWQSCQLRPERTSQARGLVCQKIEQATTDADGSSGLAATPSGLPRTWTFTYNDHGRILSADGPRTDISDLTTATYYDAADPDPGKRGNLATVTNALGQVTQITAYDLHGQPLTVIDANGSVTTLSYDARQRLISHSIDGDLTTTTYDAAGQPTAITLPDGSRLTYTWDPARRLTTIADSLGNQIVYTLDAMGNRLREEITDPAKQLVQTRQRLYDGLGRLAQEIGARDQITAYDYDAIGNRSRVTDPLDQRTLFAHDAFGRLLQITDPGLGRTRYQYDGLDRLTRVTDPRNLATLYSIDGLGNRWRQESPDTGLTTSTHDAAGNEITRTDAKGQTSTLTWDALNRLTRIRYADGSRTDYLWDQGANGIGRLTRIDDIDPTGELASRLENRYDLQGHLLSQTRRVGDVAHTSVWRWSAGRLVGLSTPGGRTIDYTRDAIGRISEVRLTDSTPGGDGRSRVIATDIRYHPFAGITSYRDGAGQMHTRHRDLDGRLAGYTLGAENWLLSYDAAGRLRAQFDAANATRSATYGYDAVDRLTSANLPSTAYGYTWDASANRTSHILGSTTRNYTIDPASNRLQNVGSVPPKIYGHDANGSIISDGARRYAYDSKGRLSQATTATAITRYQYNGLGERIRKHNSTDTRYVYDPEGRLIAESTPDGTIQREYLWLEDLPVAVLQ
jgi:YD repeat-containing protein